MSRPEFGITPLRGYRKWHVRGGRLVSCYNQVWPLRAPAQAASTHCSRAGLPIPSGTRYGHFAGEGCGLYAWNAPECMRPLALSPMFPIDLRLLEDMAAAYEIRLLMSVGEVRRAFPPLTTGAPS